MKGNTPTSGAVNAPGHLLKWFTLLVLIGPLHMAEQIMFGLDTLYELQALMRQYHALFSNPDLGTVLMVIVVVTIVQSMVLGLLAGGRWRLCVAAFFGAVGAGEAHHLIQTALQGQYFPGLVTSIPYAWIGVMVLRAVVLQWPAASRASQTRLAAAA
jgi:hypothetical protein